MRESVLLVDDDEFVCQALARMLESVGFSRIRVAANGHEAVSAITSDGRFDLILLDLHMPGGDGVEFLRWLAGQAASCELILTSGYDRKTLKSAETLARAHGIQPLGVLEKPIEREQLEEILARTEQWHETVDTLTHFEIARVQQALDARQIKPWYQPIIDANNREWVGVEALARWQLAPGVVISPAEFIPVVEEYGLATELLISLTRTALDDLRLLDRKGHAQVRLAINLSAQSLRQIDLPDQLAQLVNDSGVDPARITFELTESLLIEQIEKSLDTLTRLRLNGFKLAADDFGTGFATLSRLSELPVTALKLDRSFVTRMHLDSDARVIIESCIQLARRLELNCIAEGVETESMATALRDYGADCLQGYWVSRAIPVEQLDAWHRRWSSRL